MRGLEISLRASSFLTWIASCSQDKKNIISGSILAREGYKLNFKFNKVAILFGGSFIGKAYLFDGLFKIVVDVVELNYV